MNLEIIRLQIEGQLDQEDDSWRIARKSTWADLIIVSYYDYQRTQDIIYLLRIICNCIRIKLLENSGGREISKDPNDYKSTLSKNKAQNELISDYFNRLKTLLIPSNLDPNYELNRSIQHLKVINQQLELDDYTPSLYDEIAIVTIEVLINLP